jgi:multimeric flavodoxin WrbA
MYLYSFKEAMVVINMKILGISGSPRRGGNTDFVLEEVLRSAEEEGADVELVSIAGLTIYPCEACEFCAENKRCKHDDDVQEIYDKMLAADGIVMGAPVYFGNVPSQVKALIDRERVIWRQGKSLENKVGASVAVAWKWGHFNTLASLDGFMLTNKMMVVGLGGVPGLGLMVYAQKKGEAKNDEATLENAHKLGKRIVEAVNSVRRDQ